MTVAPATGPARPAWVASVRVESADPAREAQDLLGAVLACPGVVAVRSGDARLVVTHLPRRRVDGVRADPYRVAVSVVAAFGVPVTDVVNQVRDAVALFAWGRPVDVHVADVLLPEQIAAGQALPALPAGSG